MLACRAVYGVRSRNEGIRIRSRKMADMDIPEEAGHRVVATARGVFDSSGGVLESKETGGYTVERL